MDEQRAFTHLPFHQIAATDKARQLGLVTLETDLTIEDEVRFFLGGSTPLSVSLLHTRIAMDDEVTADTLTSMEARFVDTLALYPSDFHFDVIGYGCTSASLLIGEDRVQQIIKSHVDVAHVTTPITAAKRALDKLGAKNIGYLAPYISEISQQMCEKFTADGYPVHGAATFGESRDSIVGSIAPDAILDALITLADATPDIDAIFVSCTSLKCASIIEDAEAQLGIPVISSNSAMAWDMIRLGHVEVDTSGKGRLFTS